MRILLLIAMSWLSSMGQSTTIEEEIALDQLFENIRNNIVPYKLNVITECSRSLSPLGNKIVQRANKDFVSSNIDRENSALIINRNMTSEQVKYHGLQRVSERMSLTIGIVESANGSNLVHNMSSMLRVFDAINPLTRGKYLLIIITNDDIDLRLFFRDAWSKRFLDLTVLEWNDSHRSRLPGNTSASTISFKATVHSFNPFCDTFHSEILSQHTVLFENKVANLHGSHLPVILPEDGVSRHDIDWMLVEILCEKLNCNIHDIGIWNVKPNYNDSHLEVRVLLPFDHISFASQKDRVNIGYFLEKSLTQIYIPKSEDFYFYLMRPKEYEEIISIASVLTFAGLFFTAWIFAVWARLLGFREENWTFLNILTAQMGGSLEHHGRMKMSEKIFVMSIYIATFIVVTLGTDYMLEIFIYRGELTKIETIEDLANSNIDLTMSNYEFSLMERVFSDFYRSDPILKRIHDRIETRETEEGSITFCYTDDSISLVDESINLCVTRSMVEHRVLTSDERVQIDKIKNPIVVFLPSMRFTGIPFYKYPMEELVYRLLQVGMFERVRKRRDEYYKTVIPPISTSKKIIDKAVPPQDQLQPILLVGCTLSIFALICEIIWKRLLEKTKFGKLITGFHNRSRSTLASSRDGRNSSRTAVSKSMMMNRSVRDNLPPR
ncbi:hypothetical protein QAD02_017771 [Eretmocerus hayati]|uniref:Uncharacterized protein n=1 Tax=Eretmocerus hayati TaxID=131215 RepID=A0ACC2PHC5_9HYME|nr:hypothetical protein QAD02_017771 [Eretmocerus hayati]